MAELSLWLGKSETGICELERTLFIGNAAEPEIIAVRGKTAGAYRNAGTFQWTPGVKALSIVFLTAVSRYLKGTNTFLPLLEGERGSLASSLDYALNKQPDWLFDIFGADERGNAYLRQLLLRSNTGRRRTGPVSISLNEQLLSPQSIKIFVGEALIENADELQHLARAIIMSESQPMVELESNGRFPSIVPVSETDIDDIFQYEEEYFPRSHATRERLLQWHRHDPSNYICIKEPGKPFLAYYLMMFLKPEAMQAYLAEDLSEVDIEPAHLVEPSIEVYAQQDTMHICVFAARGHASIFTVDLVWHLMGRMLDLAVNGRLNTVYAEIATIDGKILVERFGFKFIKELKTGGTLYQLKASPAMIREWEWRYKLRTLCKSPVSKWQEALHSRPAI